MAKNATKVVRNTRKGVTLHLGDGRKLACGESAEVAAEVAAQIEAIHGKAAA